VPALLPGECRTGASHRAPSRESLESPQGPSRAAAASRPISRQRSGSKRNAAGPSATQPRSQTSRISNRPPSRRWPRAGDSTKTRPSPQLRPVRRLKFVGAHAPVGPDPIRLCDSDVRSLGTPIGVVRGRAAGEIATQTYARRGDCIRRHDRETPTIALARPCDHITRYQLMWVCSGRSQ
jgi:hypothetical protein